MTTSFHLACPSCRSPLFQLVPELYVCPVERRSYHREKGIWLFLLPELKQEYQQFMQEYQAVRAAEGRGSRDPAYYRDLPFQDRTGIHSADWRIRARSFRALLHSIVVPLEKKAGRALKLLDLGAGNGWLSNRLAQRGHSLAAIDLLTNPLDGLGAHIHFETPFIPIQADFNHLPFVENQADLVIFNASFHYSTDYDASLCEALRVLRPEGQIVILDSPIYQDERSGAAMVREREDQFLQNYGFASNAIPSENYLTYRRLEKMGKDLGLGWRMVSVFYGLAWAIRPIRARLAGHREPAQFCITAGSKQFV